MVVVKQKDFVEISYVGRIKDSKQIFDLTDEELAKKEGLFEEGGHNHFGPKIICVGENQVIPGLDKALAGKEVNKSFTVEIEPKDAFGMKDPKLLKIIQTSVLVKQKIHPYPGLQIQGPGMMGTIRAVSGGRTTVDFNHPLAGKVLVYEVKITRIVDDSKEKINASLMNLIHVHEGEYEIAIENKKATIKMKKKLPKELESSFKEEMKELLPEIEVSFA